MTPLFKFNLMKSEETFEKWRNMGYIFENVPRGTKKNKTMKIKILTKVWQMLICKHEYEELHHITLATRKLGYYTLTISRCSKCDYFKVELKKSENI